MTAAVRQPCGRPPPAWRLEVLVRRRARHHHHHHSRGPDPRSRRERAGTAADRGMWPVRATHRTENEGSASDFSFFTVAIGKKKGYLPQRSRDPAKHVLTKMQWMGGKKFAKSTRHSKMLASTFRRSQLHSSEQYMSSPSGVGGIPDLYSPCFNLIHVRNCEHR